MVAREISRPNREKKMRHGNKNNALGRKKAHRDSMLTFVDFDDARMGPAIQDLWMLLSGEPEEMGRQFGHVLAGYEMFREFDDCELQLVEALRTLRLIHHSAWLARRWGDPAFPAAFPWFATRRYWEERILELREQVAAMQEFRGLRVIMP